VQLRANDSPNNGAGKGERRRRWRGTRGEKRVQVTANEGAGKYDRWEQTRGQMGAKVKINEGAKEDAGEGGRK
jgi:hypothetical protein